MVQNRIRITVVVQNDADLAFIEQAGGGSGRGAKQAGFDALLQFAQMAPDTLRLAADALDIAADWNVDRIDVKTPPDWKMPDGFCNTRALARKLRQIAEVTKCDENN